MHPDAILQASERLDRAKQAIEAMKAEKPSPPLESLWLDFLIAANGIYPKLEKGAQGNPKSLRWFGTMKRERKTDPLLSYLHHARNADEHGLGRTTRRTSSHVTIPPGGRVVLVAIADGQWVAEALEGELGFANDVIRLVRVCDDRFHDSFDPPTSHLGQRLSDATPLGVAVIALSYLERMIAAASAL